MNQYIVKDWDDHFENNRSRKMVKMQWVPVPNKHDGEGFAYIMSQKDGMAIFGAWILILQVASKCHVRGSLVRDNGKPHTAATIAMKTRGDEKIIQKALDVCASSEVGWLQEVTQDAQEGGTRLPRTRHETATEGKERREGKEGKGRGVSSTLGKKKVMEVWNEIAERNYLPLLKSISDTRWGHYIARLKDYESMSEEDLWRVIAAEIDNMDDFPRGQNDRGWMIDFDYVVAPRGAKLIEGGWRKSTQKLPDKSDLF